MSDGAGLTIPSGIADEMLAHALRELPNEACGILGGTLDGADAGRAETFHPARNAESSPLRYSVHDDDLRRIVFAIDDAGRDLVAIFHSHTRSPAVPSATDRRAAMYPGAFYVLASLADPAADAQRSLRAWRIVRGHAYEVPLRIAR